MQSNCWRTAYLGDGSSDTTAVNYFNKRAALTWRLRDLRDVQRLHRPAAAVHQQSQQLHLLEQHAALILKKTAFCISLACTPVAGYFNSNLEDDRAVLRQVLDGFE